MSTAEPSGDHARREFGFVLVGGGLQSGLVALGVLARQPEATVAIVEAGPALGGNHTWSLHLDDVPAEARAWIDPLLVHRWPGYDVLFPNFTRTLQTAYAAITSERFASVVGAALARRRGSTCVVGRRATRIDADTVTLDEGATWTAKLVVDARGPCLASATSGAGFQKFLGLELELDRPHGLERPILMDATVPQRDGFRFFYVLPFGERRLLVEDTCFSRSAQLQSESTRDDVLSYASRFGTVTHVLREERGVLPMPWRSAHPVPTSSPLVAGYRGGWFHPATGYSAPCALRLACHLAERGPRDVFGPALQRLHRAHREQASYAEHLNRLLFGAFAPGDMRNVFERFYRLPAPLIRRFYDLSTTWADRARILAGPPPRGLSWGAAIASWRSP